MPGCRTAESPRSCPRRAGAGPVALVVGASALLGAVEPSARASSGSAATERVGSGCGTRSRRARRRSRSPSPATRVVIVHVPTGYRARRRWRWCSTCTAAAAPPPSRSCSAAWTPPPTRTASSSPTRKASSPSGTGFDWNVPGVPLFGGARSPAAPPTTSRSSPPGARSEQRYCIDEHRVYATGFSGGARMSSQLACDASSIFAAVAPVSGLRTPSPCPTHAAVP